MNSVPSELEAALLGDHLLVQDARYANPVRPQTIKNHVLATLVSSQPWTDLGTSLAHPRIRSEHLKTELQVGIVLRSLCETPSLDRVFEDVTQIILSGLGEQQNQATCSPCAAASSSI